MTGYVHLLPTALTAGESLLRVVTATVGQDAERRAFTSTFSVATDGACPAASTVVGTHSST